MTPHAPLMPVIGPLECFNDQAATEATVAQVLAQGPVAGVYGSGSGSTGIHAALRRFAVEPVWISHEASAQHAALLRDGALSLVLDQDSEGQAQSAIDYLLYSHGLLPTPPLTQLQLKIVIAESLRD